MEAVSDRELLALLFDPRVAVAAVVARNGVVSAWSDAAREVLEGDVGQSVDSLFDPGSRAKLSTALEGRDGPWCSVLARRTVAPAEAAAPTSGERTS